VPPKVALHTLAYHLSLLTRARLSCLLAICHFLVMAAPPVLWALQSVVYNLNVHICKAPIPDAAHHFARLRVAGGYRAGHLLSTHRYQQALCRRRDLQNHLQSFRFPFASPPATLAAARTYTPFCSGYIVTPLSDFKELVLLGPLIRPQAPATPSRPVGLIYV
jgi:hypothetical protein